MFLSLSLKIMGRRQLGELEVGELVSTLVLSEVAALPIADPDIPLANAVIPVILIVCTEIIISSIKNKSEKLKKYIEGKPIFLIYKGVIQEKELSKNRISINELLCEIRMQGIFDIRDVYYAILEQNGKLSVFENGDKKFTHSIITDSEIDKEVLSRLGRDEKWLESILNSQNTALKDVFLMVADDSGETYIIRKRNAK